MAKPAIDDGAQLIEGRWWKSEGGAIIDPTVQFQSFVSVKRGLYRDTYTRIRAGTYVASGVSIGHNVEIGRDCIILPNAVICGWAVLGDHVWVSPGVIIPERIRIGSWVKIRAGEVVTRDIPDYTYYGKNGDMVHNKSRSALMARP